jgi:D-inositol-3-phosphate glycosyltransferase
LFLAYRFGLPVIASDVGSLAEDVSEGRTGFMFKPDAPDELARAIERYFDSGLFQELEQCRKGIREYALARYSWEAIGKKTSDLYLDLLRN